MRMRFLTGTIFALVLSAAAANAQQASDTVAPEKATAVTMAKRVEAKSFMVVAANPLAAEAGREVIAKGGNAIGLAAKVKSGFMPSGAVNRVDAPRLTKLVVQHDVGWF